MSANTMHMVTTISLADDQIAFWTICPSIVPSNSVFPKVVDSLKGARERSVFVFNFVICSAIFAVNAPMHCCVEMMWMIAGWAVHNTLGSRICFFEDRKSVIFRQFLL
mmetsp:Transcript_26779/g.35663  ORF Transcript_26779/g.35663 Transcript_26779/m.35663 type:complete len:108 (+) Transcript_26779:467-790(+)